MTPEQITALRAIVEAEASLADARAAGNHHAIAEWLNAREVDADIDAPREAIIRATLARGTLGKMGARMAMLAAKATALATTSGLDAPGLATIEAEMAEIENARRSFELLPSFKTGDAATKAFVAATLTTLVARGIMSSADATAFLALGRGFVSRAADAAGVGEVTLLDVAKIMEG